MFQSKTHSMFAFITNYERSKQRKRKNTVGKKIRGRNLDYMHKVNDEREKTLSA